MVTCFCRRCSPTPAANQCSVCGQEVRIGERHGRRDWWHREDVDHLTIHGHISVSVTAPSEHVEEPKDEHPMGPPEITARPIDLDDLPPRSGLRQIVNLVLGKGKGAPKDWDLVNVTHARGHYMSAKGTSLGISDSHVLRARGPVELDGTRRIAVGSWRDLAFDFAVIGILDGRVIRDSRPVTSAEMKDWIRGHDVPDSLSDEPEAG